MLLRELQMNTLCYQQKELEDKGKSIICVLYMLQFVKGTSQDEVKSSSEKIKFIALYIVELRMTESISKLLVNLVQSSVIVNVKI